jgi:hypothetical protein
MKTTSIPQTVVANRIVVLMELFVFVRKRISHVSP